MSEQESPAEIRWQEEERRDVAFWKRVLIFTGVAAALGAVAVSWLIPGHESTPDGKASGKASAGNITWTDCWFEGGEEWPHADCGLLTVDEDRSREGGKTVVLPFIVFRAFEPEPDQVPLLVAGGGGPGAPLGIGPEDSVEMDALWLAYYFASVGDGRDLILMDNRGVGSSKPRLNCPESEKLELELLPRSIEPEEYAEEASGVLRRCRERLEGQGIDLNSYNSIAAAQDIEDLRIGLGLEKINLYGASYGSRIALTYLRDFPESTRAAILDGVLPLEVNDIEVSADESVRSFRRIFELCRQDPQCRQRFGADLYERSARLIQRLDKEPVPLVVTDPDTLRAIKMSLTPDVLLGALFNAIYDSGRVGEVPLILTSLLNGSTDYASALVRDDYVRPLGRDSLDEGAYASYRCHDEIPFNDFDLAARAAAKDPVFGIHELYYIFGERSMCDAWGVRPGPEIESRAVTSSVPTLVYSGELDPATPAHWARDIGRNLVKARSWVWKGIGHGVLYGSSCAETIAGDFLDNPEADPFKNGCLDEENGVHFTLD